MFITDLHKLAVACDYVSMREDLIRDRTVVGLLDKSLCEKLQLDYNLETVRRQQTELRGQDALRTDADEVKREPSHRTSQSRRCGNSPRGAESHSLILVDGVAFGNST